MKCQLVCAILLISALESVHCQEEYEPSLPAYLCASLYCGPNQECNYLFRERRAYCCPIKCDQDEFNQSCGNLPVSNEPHLTASNGVVELRTTDRLTFPPNRSVCFLDQAKCKQGGGIQVRYLGVCQGGGIE